MPEKRAYKHQVTAAIAIEAITTINWTAAQTKKFNAGGIYRGTPAKLNATIPELKNYYLYGIAPHTLLFDTEIIDDETLTISNIKAQLPHIILQKSKVNGIEISNSTLSNKEEEGQLKSTHFYIVDSTIRKFRISDNSTTGYFSIENSKTGKFWISDNSTTGDFSISNSTSPFWEIEGVTARFSFSKATIGQCLLTHCNISSLSIKNGCAMELYISDGAINLINFERLSLGISTILSFSNIDLYACNMNEFSALGNLYFRKIKKADSPFSFFDIEKYLDKQPDTEHLKRQYESKKTLLESQKKEYESELSNWQKRLNIHEPTFRVVQSSLGTTEFTECDLGGFRFEYNNSNINHVFISGGTLPEKDIIIYKEKENSPSKNFQQQKVAVYTQLKQIFSRLGNVYYESKFHAQASHHQLKLLKHLRKEEAKKSKYKQWKLLVGEETFEILIYRLNQVSNKHRASWGRSLGFIAVSSGFIFTFYLLAGGAISLNSAQTQWDWKLVGQIFTFINPTHSINFMADAGFCIHSNFWSNLWDFFARIVMGYGIYQLIAAFRKHGRKG